MKNRILYITLFLAVQQLMINAQSHTISRTLRWTGVKEISISKYNKLKLPHFDGAVYLDEPAKAPWFSETVPVKSSGDSPSYTFEKAQWQPLSAQEAELLKGISFGASPVVRAHIIYERGKPQLELNILPIRSNQGTIEKLTSFELAVRWQATNNVLRKSRSSSTTESVLAGGSFVKVGVTASGVYQIPRAMLATMGMNVGINPKNLRVYGNGGAMLPERNNVFYPDDLIENAIVVSGESDNSFDEGDYILFYAHGPTVWTYDATRELFRQQRNIYSDTAWYFITADKGPGKRISPQAQSDLPVTVTAATFDDYAFIENDEENFLASGRRWFGNRMEVINSHSFTVSMSNLASGPHKLASRLANRGSSASNFSVSVNGQTFSQPVNSSDLNYLSPYVTENESLFNFSTSSSSINVSVAKPSNNSIGWIDYLTFNFKRNLIMDGSWMDFRNRELTEQGAVIEYSLGNANSSIRIWEVTNLYDIREQNATLNGSSLRFKVNSDTLREFVAVNVNGSFLQPIAGGLVANQNLHGLAQPDMIIVAPRALLSQANTLANLHRNYDGLDVIVAEVNQIYNEFSSGKQDIAGIRNFVRMFYERAEGNTEEMPRYLLMMGDGTFRPKRIGENGWTQLPTYESVESINPIGSYGSDDFFGLLDPTEGASIHSSGAGALDISIGRLPVSNVDEANAMLYKIEYYMTSQSTMNDWRNRICFVADDEDNNTHLEQQELVSAVVAQKFPVYNIDKVYLDAYPQESGAGGQRYPLVNLEIDNEMERGVLMMNYAGHGGEEGLALERVITIPDIEGYENLQNMPLFLTATCEFSRFDNPDFTSAGEYLVVNPQGGAIAAFTTTRLTFSTSNQALNRNVMDTLFSKVNGGFQRMGDILRAGKNKTGSSANNRSFALMGDPALMLAYPKQEVFTSSINGKNPAAFPDTISALELVTITGFVSADGVNPDASFNGVVVPTVFDKPTTLFTIGNDIGSGGSAAVPFQLQQNIIFRGPASVVNGQFSFSFVVPQDIQLQNGFGKISYYARKTGSLTDAHGYLNNLLVGGFSANPTTDDEGPTVRLFMNNEQFVSGGITDESPTLLAFVEDDIGINTVGTGIGHDITAVLDGNSSNPYILNDFYEPELDNFRKGTVRYPFRELSVGPHTITFKVWDVANNSSTASIDFVVVENEEMAINHVLNYPNPFTTNTQFFFESNQPGVPLTVEIQVFTVSGKMVKNIETVVQTSGYRSEPISWNGRDDYGDKIGRGVYVYRLKVTTPDGKTAEKFEKLVILN